MRLTSAAAHHPIFHARPKRDPLPLVDSGLSWLHRWALGKGMEIRMEPREDKYIRELQQR